MVLLHDLSHRLELNDAEERRVLTQVSWAQYEALLTDLGAASSYRVQFLKGVLEIVSPSRRHESGKTRIGTLLEIYFLETDTDYYPMGSTTLRQQEVQAGVEPDESYCIGSNQDIPDLAIEVIVTSGSINRLELYRRLGIQEVWFWERDHLTLYTLRAETPMQFVETAGYESIPQSILLSALDIDLLTRCIQHPQPLAAAKMFRQGIQHPR